MSIAERSFAARKLWLLWGFQGVIENLAACNFSLYLALSCNRRLVFVRKVHLLPSAGTE